jgi:hypothetical protein
MGCFGIGTILPFPDGEQMWLRFVDGRPVSAITTQFLDWCCERLLLHGKGNWLLSLSITPAFHVSKLARSFIREHNQQVKQSGQGVRILPFFLPTKSRLYQPH